MSGATPQDASRRDASVYEAVGELRAAGCDDEADAVERLKSERDALKAELGHVRLERDDFEQRLHAYKNGEIA